MSILTDLYNSKPETVLQMQLEQIISIAVGTLCDSSILLELRNYFTKVDNAHIKKYVKQCLSWTKKDNKTEIGFVLQDLVNEIGKRIGYEVCSRVYKGKVDENGFNGLWKCTDDDTFIIVESKTNGTFARDPSVVLNYRDKLIAEKKIIKSKSSILIVLGKDKNGIAVGAVRGSSEPGAIRVISADSLCKLLDIYDTNSSESIRKKINNVLKPVDYTKLDPLIELVFSDCIGKNKQEKTNGNKSLNKKSLIPKLDHSIVSTCTFVKTTMNNLSKSGYTFDNELLKFMQTSEFTKKYFRNRKALHLPFLITTDKPRQIKNSKQPRYWKDVLTFNGKQFYAMSQWDNHDGSRERFIEWYNTL